MRMAGSLDMLLVQQIIISETIWHQHNKHKESEGNGGRNRQKEGYSATSMHLSNSRNKVGIAIMTREVMCYPKLCGLHCYAPWK